MMQILEAGGMPILKDDVRKPDEGNPKGYYEYSKVKRLAEDNSWLDEAEGKAVKVISLLLYDLPLDRQYKIIFMRRSMEEILLSQATLLSRSDSSGHPIADKEMEKNFRAHLAKLEKWISKHPKLKIHYCSYNRLLKDTKTEVDRMQDFLGANLDISATLKAIDPILYRQRC